MPPLPFPRRLSLLALLLAPWALAPSADPPPAPAIPPKSPREELATFRVAPGFRVDLAAAEPAVIDPRNRNRRFQPDRPGSLEPTSGGGQYGLAADDLGDWFTCTNSQHLRHIVLPDHALRRNPHLAVPAVVLDIPDHGAVAKLYRISPFEPWRVE